MTDEELIAAVDLTLKRLQETAAAVYGVHVNFFVTISGRMTTCAGRAFYETGEIRLSRKLFTENYEDFISNTIPHEFVHLVAFALYGEEGKGHGARFKEVVSALGVVTSRLHSYKVERNTSNTVEYTCGCRVWNITPQRIAWMKRGKVYTCKNCGGVLVQKS